ncbi:putative disease resistance RPP13-like protein 1 [Chenopodium quinoa]|uniref:putative disease resistance RPP13-like protein 1 n=1 Tax=Chenopodium quinoa TaxID=63459 RepID=UPI000B772339|nr:putative disease resistance RPP13-like protein 1 [Chenopodium quinoa]
MLNKSNVMNKTEKTIRLWLEYLQDLGFDLEDLLDDFAFEAFKMTQDSNDHFHVHRFKKNVRRFLPTSFHNMVGILACGCSATATRQIGYSVPEFSSRIDEINNALNKIKSRAPTLSLLSNICLPTYAVEEQQRKMPETSSLIKEPHVYGRDGRKKDIICQLLEDKPSYENYVVIPIVGMGGIGKTTLAQCVYNDEKVKAHFAVKAWVCVSDVFDVKRVTKDVINSATHGNFDCSNLNQAQEKLQQKLKGQKFLIVLDDVWSESYEDWDQLRTPFLGAARGSRVIVTSRSDRTEKKMTKNHSTIIRLEGLSGDDCWRLFQQHANVDDFEIKDDIVRKCKGLPLAAKTLGGLIKCTTEKSKRREILESNVWCEEYEECNVLPVLRVSYHYLPSYLKRVFAYCSVLPKDYEFEEMEITQLWMAQGFLPNNKGRRMEDIGQNYFNDLVSRSLFEKKTFFQGFYIMHDLIHDVAKLAAGDVCYVMDAVDTPRNLRRTRHLFITEHVQTLGNQIMVPQLRTFLCNYCLSSDNLDFIQRMQYVRSLYLVSDKIEVLPEYIGNLKHLHYLRLKFERIKVLPQSISNLWNLQTLCLEGCYTLVKVPCIESLGKLRHLNFGNISLEEMPLGIGKLTNLQTLKTFVLAAGGGSRVRELGKLNQLHGRLFTISGLENVTEVGDAEEAQLCKKENLDGLNLKWETCTDEVDDKTRRDVVEMLRPHTSIKECELDGYMGLKFPSWLRDPSFINMVQLKLKNCQKCVCLPPLGQLRSLKSLLVEYMDGIKEVGLEFYGNCSTPPFPSLKTLEFSHMKSWEKWVHLPVDCKAFSILETLYMYDCPSLQGNLPPLLPSLKRLKINELKNMERLAGELLNFTSLDDLRIEKCPKLHSLVEGGLPLEIKEANLKQAVTKWELHLLHSLKFLRLENVGTSVDSQECIPCLHLSLPSSLFELQIKSFQNLKTISNCSTLPNLTYLDVGDCPRLESLVSNSTSVTHLSVHNCPKLHNFPQGDLPTNLMYLSISGTKIDKPIKEWGLHLLTSLYDLTLANVGSCVDTLESFSYPDFPSSLHLLAIEGFQNLKTICCSTLPKLRYMDIKYCSKLESFGDNGLPAHIIVYIKECDMIQQQLASDPNGCIITENERHSLPLSNGRMIQPSSAHSTC